MNNNLANVNSPFIGATHLDNYSVLSNVLVKNIINTSNYISNVSNVLEYEIHNTSNYILNTSNALIDNINYTSNYIYNSSNALIVNINNTSNYIYNSSNQITNEFKNLIYNYKDGTGIFNSALNTHIYNNNILGEIRFLTNGTPSYFGNNYKFITKIQENGQLAVYYPYNPAYPTVFPQWYIVSDTIRDNYAYQGQTNLLLATIQQEINTVNNHLYPLEIVVGTLATNVELLNGMSVEELDNMLTTLQQQGTFNVFNNASIMGLSASTVIGIAASVIGSILYNNNIQAQTAILDKMNNPNITETKKRDLITQTSNISIQNLYTFNSNMSNLNVLNGFINSNILTSQLIPNISTNNIDVNGNVYMRPNNYYYGSAYYLSNIQLSTNSSITSYSSNFISSNILTNVLQPYTNYNYSSNFISSNILKNVLLLYTNYIYSSNFISSNILTNVLQPYPNYNYVSSFTSNFLPKTGGSLSGGLGVLPATVAIPATGNFGGIGDRIVLYNGSTGVYPYSIGINTNSFWNSIPTGANFDWYINGTKNMTLSSGTLNIIGNIQKNGNDIDNIYISSNVLSYQNFINSNSIAINYINSNVVPNILTPYITSNVLTSVIYSYLPLYKIFISNTNSYLDPTNLLYTYDLDVSKYVKTYTTRNAGTLIRVFEITTIIENADWEYANKVLTQGFFETITIYMSNFTHINGSIAVLPNYCNGKIIGKQNSTNVGYWNTMMDNFNYIRFLSNVAWDLNVSIRPLF